MEKFKIRAYAVDYYEEEIEAESKEKAKEIFLENQDKGEFEYEEMIFFEQDEGFDILNELAAESE
jgi:hypothetical protein